MRRAASQEEIAIRLRPLRRSDLPTDTLALARYLIGMTLVRELPLSGLSVTMPLKEGGTP